MVAVHGISLDKLGGAPALSAAALSLASPPRRNRIHRFPTDGWEIELRQSVGHVVARTTRALAGDHLLDEAIDVVHRALDVTSVENGDHLSTVAPADSHILLAREDSLAVVSYQGITDFGIEINATAGALRPDGTVESAPPPASLWSPAFRFHRLSQGSRDLFDAYRNMFLGLEALLDQLFPKKPNERERAWLARAIAAAGTKVDLHPFSRGGTDPAADIVDRLYPIRLQLFHAKTGRTLIPQERASYLQVSDAYRTLVSLWTEVARAWLSLKRGGTVLSYHMFKAMIDGGWQSSRLALTADLTPFDKNESAFSPCGLPVVVFPDAPIISELRPGRMEMRGRIETKIMPPKQAIGRVGAILPNGHTGIVDTIGGGLDLEGADVFESVFLTRLFNRGVPRTEFS